MVIIWRAEGSCSCFVNEVSRHFVGYTLPMGLPSRLSLLCALALNLGFGAAAWAQSSETAQRYIVAASRLYANLEYERALEQVKRARQASGGVDDDVTSALWEGAILFDLGRADDARAAFREGLYLKPDATLPVKVAPKIAAAFEQMRTDVKKELAPILAKKAAEDAAKRKTAEETEVRLKKEEEARRAQAQVQADEEAKLRARADTAARDAEAANRRADDEARRRAEDDARRAQDELARLNTEIAARKQAEADAKVARAEQDRLLTPLRDRPEQRSLVPEDRPPGVLTPVPTRVPISPFIFGGLTLAAGGVAGYFGFQAQAQINAARDARFQDETISRLQQANAQALIANIALGTAIACGVGLIIALVVDRPTPPPARAEAP